jgi:hypothetical protein
MDKLSISGIRNKIHVIRGFHVILDRDLAELYEVKSIRLREQVKRNILRFPPDFMFQLDYDEVEFLVSQNAIPSKKYLGGFLPYAFTEQGVANLSGVLRSGKAIDVNLQIMRTFVAMRKFISTNAQIFSRVDALERKSIAYDKKFEQVFDAIESKDIKPDKKIFFDGQVFDSYVFVSDIIKSAKSPLFSSIIT